MALSVIRFDMRVPGLEPGEIKDRYREAIRMSTWADEQGLDMVVLSEHHAASDGFLPSPIVMASAIAQATERIGVTIAALLVPLHDPVRLAEDLAVLDHLSEGRVAVVAGLGYRPVEYEMFGRDWTGRGALFDEALDTMLRAWRGEPVEHHGVTVHVTPRPFSSPHPMLFVGGIGKRAARRAARFGLSFFPQVGDPELVELYHAECERHGTTPGMVSLPSGPGSVFVAEDPDRAWAQIGPYLLHDARTYHAWQRDGITSHVDSAAQTVEDLRAEGIYQILTPEQCIETARTLDELGAITQHPLCGGTPPELAWESLELYATRVLPALRAG